MSLQSLSDVYGQREKGAATSLAVGYAQVYFAYLFNPFLLAFGWQIDTAFQSLPRWLVSSSPI